MKDITPWTLLRGGKAEQRQGIRQLYEANTRERDGSTIMELGVGYLWINQYEEAWEHFNDAIEHFPIKGDAFYGMAGTAKWCLGEPAEAVSHWRAGLTAKYARASGLGIRMPLLLFFVSVVKPELVDYTFVKRLLLEKAEDPGMDNWPAPIAKRVLGQITDEELRKNCSADADDASDARDCLWLAEFYEALMNRKQSTTSAFRARMHDWADTGKPEWQDEDAFFTRIWSEEFFLGRHEARKP